MIKMYAINATVVQTVPGGRISRQLPTFFLNPNVQGIINEEDALNIAERIIDPDGRYAELDICAKEVYCSAEEV